MLLSGLSDCDCCHNSVNMLTLLQTCYLGSLSWPLIYSPWCISLLLIDPDRSRSNCWNTALHCCRNVHSAEKPNTSTRPDLVLSNISGNEDKALILASVSFGTGDVIRWLLFLYCLCDTAAFHLVIWWYKHPFKNVAFVRRVMLTMATLTEHHHAGFVIERGVVGIHECLLQFFCVNVATTIWIHRWKPLVGLRVHTRRNGTYNMKTDYISELDANQMYFFMVCWYEIIHSAQNKSFNHS